MTLSRRGLSLVPWGTDAPVGVPIPKPPRLLGRGVVEISNIHSLPSKDVELPLPSYVAQSPSLDSLSQFLIGLALSTSAHLALKALCAEIVYNVE